MNSDLNQIKISAILLAAGGSERLGFSKQLLEWRDKPLISFILDLLRQIGFYSIIVVVGANSDAIKKAVNRQNITFVKNPIWHKGIGTSIKAGIKTISKKANAAIIFVVDQPYLSTDLINKLIEAYIDEKSQIVAPIVNGIQTNPVLFDRSVFDELMKLKDDEGAKNLLHSYRLKLLKYKDHKLLIDIDTIEDYQKLIK